MKTELLKLTTSVWKLVKESSPKRGVVNPEYGIYLGGEDLDDNWDLLPGYHFKYAMQCPNPNAVASMMKTVT